MDDETLDEELKTLERARTLVLTWASDPGFTPLTGQYGIMNVLDDHTAWQALGPDALAALASVLTPLNPASWRLARLIAAQKAAPEGRCS